VNGVLGDLLDHVPVDALDGVACYSRETEQRLNVEIETRGLALKTGIQPNWYF
jgi:hypothetical protein